MCAATASDPSIAYFRPHAAAAEVNRDFGLLPADLCSAIAAAAREIETGRLDTEFPFDGLADRVRNATSMNIN
jgi:fumarate hydratase class II